MNLWRVYCSFKSLACLFPALTVILPIGNVASVGAVSHERSRHGVSLFYNYDPSNPSAPFVTSRGEDSLLIFVVGKRMGAIIDA